MVLADPACSVHRVPRANVVVWWIPGDVSPADCLSEARVFALESDLVVGALKEGGLLIAGRQRAIPYDVLPPLRVETIALLAALHEKDELEQSYQRMSPGAGPYTPEFDWAPIWLSPELVDTEYGQLLNVADQLLKGWSQHGEVTYERFPYPTPAKWPFESSLADIVKEKFDSDTITFNWNTTGAGYSVATGSLQLYAPYRTGALPVSYIPGENPRLAPHVLSYEDTAYTWFSALDDPTLVRVVQYAALYQVFHNFGVRSPDEDPPVSHAPETAFAAAMAAYWKHVDTVTAGDGDRLAESSALVARYRQYVTRQARAAAAARLPAGPMRDVTVARVVNRFVGNVQGEIREEITSGIDAWRGLDPAKRAHVVQVGSTLNRPIEDATARAAVESADIFLAAVAAHDRVADDYATRVTVDGRTWIHTPTVVMSNPGADNPDAIGGHNVRAAVSKLALASDVPEGQIAFRNGALRINSADVNRAPSIVREFARGMQAGEDPGVLSARLGTMLKNAKPVPVRPPIEALRLTHIPAGGAIPASEGVTVLSATRIPVPARVTALTAAEARVSPGQVYFIKDGAHVWVAGPGSNPAVPVSNLADASELATVRLKAYGGRGGDRPVRLLFGDLSAEERQTLVADLRSDARRQRHSQDVVAIATEDPGAAAKAWRLSRDDYDFGAARVLVNEPKLVGGDMVSKVIVELPARRSGIRNAVIEFWIRVKGAITESQLGKLAQAIRIRIQEVLGTIAANPRLQPLDAVTLLQSEMNRVAKKYNVAIETHVHDAGGDWQLVAAPSTAHRA
jgi:hypothetical protein